MMPYSDEKLAEMKQDIADRTFAVKIKGMLITGAFIALAIGAGAIFPPAIAPLVMVASSLGGGLAALATLKETKKLQIDENILGNYISSKSYWGTGYREEVAERGYSLGGPVPGFPPNGKDQNYRA